MSGQDPGGASSGEELSAPTRKRSGTVGMGVAIGLAVVLLLVGVGAGYVAYSYLNPKSTTHGASGGTVQITETGSSLLFPLMKIWGPNYTKVNANVILSPASTGSGTGQSYAENGLINIGASDAYLKNASATNLLNIPVAISSQLVYYNLPGVSVHLNLNGTILAEIYSGKITSWTDPMLLAAQSPTGQTQLKALTSTTISPIFRSDSSGDTFLFSSLCDMSYANWTYGNSTSALSGLKIANSQGATGNSGVVAALQKTSGSIGYVGISYEASAASDNLVYAALGDNTTLKNGTYAAAASNYILPSAANISTDVSIGMNHLQYSSYQLAVSLILGGSPLGAIKWTKGAGGTAPAAGQTPYPIVNLEYALIKTAPTGNTVSAAALGATVAFLQWAITLGNYQTDGSITPYLQAVNFIPLTAEVIGYDEQELSTVST